MLRSAIQTAIAIYLLQIVSFAQFPSIRLFDIGLQSATFHHEVAVGSEDPVRHEKGVVSREYGLQIPVLLDQLDDSGGKGEMIIRVEFVHEEQRDVVETFHPIVEQLCRRSAI